MIEHNLERGGLLHHDVRNPGYPGKYSTAVDCEWRISKTREDICQIRLDFQTMEIADPNGCFETEFTRNKYMSFLVVIDDDERVGKCETDTFQVRYLKT